MVKGCPSYTFNAIVKNEVSFFFDELTLITLASKTKSLTLAHFEGIIYYLIGGLHESSKI